MSAGRMVEVSSKTGWSLNVTFMLESRHISNGWQPDLSTGPVNLPIPNCFTLGH